MRYEAARHECLARIEGGKALRDALRNEAATNESRCSEDRSEETEKQKTRRTSQRYLTIVLIEGREECATYPAEAAMFLSIGGIRCASPALRFAGALPCAQRGGRLGRPWPGPDLPQQAGEGTVDYTLRSVRRPRGAMLLR